MIRDRFNNQSLQVPNFLMPACVPACALLAAGSPTTPAYVVTSAGRSVSQRVNENLRIPITLMVFVSRRFTFCVSRRSLAGCRDLKNRSYT